jgi:prephenate dehydrogenase
MWRDIAIANRRHLRKALAGYLRHLRNLDEMLERGDGDALAAFFERAKQLRDQWSVAASSQSPE